jgi:hypothetical protein
MNLEHIFSKNIDNNFCNLIFSTAKALELPAKTKIHNRLFFSLV